MTDYNKPSQYLLRLGARIFSEANDLKRTPEALARDIKMAPDTVKSVINGVALPEIARAVAQTMSDVYPISLAALWVEPDDTDDGVHIMRASESARKSRIFDRKDSGGKVSPYYEYRDTAMSRNAPFKPEWIRPIRVIGDIDPDNPDVAYNKGHLMHQCTFFIGEVNFYWQIDGKSFAAEMNTGDSNFIAPFVPHSFTSRNPDALGQIIAVTYAGRVRRAVDEFEMLGAEAIDCLVGDRSATGSHFATRLHRHLEAESLDPGQLISRLEELGVDAQIATNLVEGRAVPGPDQILLLASALNIRAEDLTVTPFKSEDAVSLRFARDTRPRSYPNGNEPIYRLRELARNQHQPGLKGFEISVIGDGWKNTGRFRHGLHQYIYNYGETPVTINWRRGANENASVINPGDSAYVQPMIEHAFAVKIGECGHLAVIRIPGTVDHAVLDELATFSPFGRTRVGGENTQWF